MIYVPKKAFAENDDAGEAVYPDIGTEVDLGGVKAKIASEQGDNFCVEVTSVNDVPVAAAAEEAKPGEPDGASLMAEAAKMDEEAGL